MEDSVAQQQQNSPNQQGRGETEGEGAEATPARPDRREQAKRPDLAEDVAEVTRGRNNQDDNRQNESDRGIASARD
jgi:hypothetical protein